VASVDSAALAADAAALARPRDTSERAARLRAAARWLWSAALLASLTFLVLYPVAMLLLGALTNTNPVVDGFGVFDLSIANFVTVLANPNVHLALANSLVACGGGTALAVLIGLTFSWVVVRTDTPCKRFIAAVSLIPLFVPPLVAAVAWAILASPKTGLLNTALAGAGLGWRFNVYSMSGLIVIFGIYYAPYVYMFTASALRNMDPALEEAAEISGAGAFKTLLTVTFPLTARVAAQRYQGTQTIYELAMLGSKLDALELGTAARFAVGSEVAVVLPPALCWAYPARDGTEDS
jgi:iron(III) transport system permease protein